MLNQTTFEQFKSAVAEARAAGKKVVTVVREILGDFITPVMAYQKLATSEGAALLESVSGGKHQGRYSIIAINPYLTASVKLGILHTNFSQYGCGAGGFKEFDQTKGLLATGPLGSLCELIKYYSPEKTCPFFTGGAVGFLGHEAVTLLESSIPLNATDDLGLPDVLLNFYRHILVFDSNTQGLHLVSNEPIVPEFDASDWRFEHFHWSYYKCANRDLDSIENKLRGPLADADEFKAVGTAITSSFTEQDFVETIVAAKKHIAAGDVFQVVLSQRFKTPFPASRSLDFYRLLRRANPSPYLFHLDFGGGFKLVGASPEVMVSIQDSNMLLRPLAGTRKRGATAEEDSVLAKELANDPKEQAEHRMLVDLGRNDVGKFAEPGSVKVEGLMRVEPYGAVLHMATDIRGKLREDVSSFEALLGCLPAGTLSGAPKIRALQLIAELEPCQRGPYGGALGWFTDTDLDTCIMIRSAVIHQNKLYWQVGAGIVADSDPASEYQETLNKSISIRKVLMQMAGEQQ